MSEFCKKCGATFPHRYGEGRCEECLPRAFNEALADRDEWERLWKKASVAVIDLQDEVELLRGQLLSSYARIDELELSNVKLRMEMEVEMDGALANSEIDTTSVDGYCGKRSSKAGLQAGEEESDD